MATNDPTTLDDAAFVDAYERRIAGGLPGDVPVQWRDEIEAMARMHQRIAALPMPEVSPAVRSVVLTAAAQAAADHAQPQSVFARLADWLFRPGPVLAMASAAALLIAVSARQDKDTTAPTGAEAVAVADRPPPVLTAEPYVAPPPAPPAAVAATAPAAAPMAGAAAPAPDRAEAGQVAFGDEPLHNAPIEAKPASLGPAQVAETKLQRAPKAEAEQQFAQPPPKQAQVANADKGYAGKDDAVRDEAAQVPGAAMGMVANNKAAAADKNQAPQEEAEQARRNQALDNAVLRKAEDIQRGAYGNQQAENRAAASSAPSTPAPVQNRAENAPAAQAESAANSAVAEVARLRAEVEKTSDATKKLALLKILQGVAIKAGDAKTAGWAKAQVAAVEAERVAPGKVQRAKAAEPVKAKASGASSVE